MADTDNHFRKHIQDQLKESREKYREPTTFTEGHAHGLLAVLPGVIAAVTDTLVKVRVQLNVAQDEIAALKVQQGILLDRLAEVEDLATKPGDGK